MSEGFTVLIYDGALNEEPSSAIFVGCASGIEALVTRLAWKRGDVVFRVEEGEVYPADHALRKAGKRVLDSMHADSN